MARVFGERIGNWLRSVHEEHGVQFRLGAGVEAIHGDGRVQSVLLSDGAEANADVVVVGIGVTPAVDFLEGSGLVEAGAVQVDSTLRTPADGVYAAGDVAVVPESRSGEPRRIEHWIVAERQGQHAARAMLGSEEPYASVPLFWTMQFGTSVKYAGLARQPDDIVYRGEVESGKFVAGYYEGGRLKAIAGSGLTKPFFALYELLGRGQEVSADVLADPGTKLTSLLGG
jgi:NADPH-dependent 2,4-dienoyl-CoA reductase/sulfur reductase-like enzyme